MRCSGKPEYLQNAYVRISTGLLTITYVASGAYGIISGVIDLRIFTLTCARSNLD